MHRGWVIITAWIRRGLERLHRIYIATTSRHVRRWVGESSYRRTLLAALVALGGTLLPHPVAAAALGAIATEWRPRDTFDPYADDDEYEYEPRGRRLWETFP